MERGSSNADGQAHACSSQTAEDTVSGGSGRRSALLGKNNGNATQKKVLLYLHTPCMYVSICDITVLECEFNSP